MKTIQIELPDDVLDEIGEARAQTLAREALLVRLYDLGEISGDTTAEVIGISRADFLELLDSYGVSAFDETMDEGEGGEHG